LFGKKEFIILIININYPSAFQVNLKAPC